MTYQSKLKSKKVVAILKEFPPHRQTLEHYDILMTLSENTLDMMLDDFNIDITPIVPQMDLTAELEFLK